MSGKLNKNCPNCGFDCWWSMDNKEYYTEVCQKCSKTIHYDKKSYLNNFKCEKCGSNSGTLNDNDNNLSIVCSDCGHNNIVLEKHYVEISHIHDENVGIIVDKKPVFDRNVRCPVCFSDQIQATNRGYSLLTGFIGANKTVNHCLRCGHSWKPKL